MRRRERLGLAMGALRLLLDSVPWCAWWLRIGVRVVAVRRVRPAGASGTEWTLWTPGPCLGRARSLSLGVGLGRYVLTPRGDRACDPKHQLRTHVLQPASPVGGTPDGRDVPLALAVRVFGRLWGGAACRACRCVSWRAFARSVALRVRRGLSILKNGEAASGSAGYLVDPASSHMLVSKIKPCMSKYKRLVL